MEEVFNSSEIRLFDIPSSLLEIYWLPIVSDYSVLQKFGNEFQSTLIIRDSPFSYYRILLSGLISLHLGAKFCLRCFSELPIYSSDAYCSSCYSSSETSYRMCLFHSPNSVYSEPCSPSSPACGDLTNVSKCYSRYYLYFGRFGNSIKVGISRFYTGKFKFYRLIQQGLNEAVVIYPFASLPEVTSYERFLIDEIGIQESLSFSEKVENLLTQTFTTLSDYYTIEQIQELFPEHNIRHLKLYPDNPLEYIPSSFKIEVKKIVDNIVGNIIYSQGNVCVLKQKNELLFFDLSKLKGRTLEVNKSW